MSDCADKLRKLGIRVCSFENLSGDQNKPITFSDASLREILDAIIEKNPGYHWDEPSVGLLNIFPKRSVLDSLMPTVALRSKGSWRVLEDNLQISKLGIIFFGEFGDPDGPIIDLDLEHADLRAVLNTIVAQIDPLVWHITGLPDVYYLNFTTIISPVAR